MKIIVNDNNIGNQKAPIARLLPLSVAKTNSSQFGGKARGLALMQSWGVRIPITFILESEDENLTALTELFQDLLVSYPQVESWAIRSSASLEDGKSHSFAGLFESFLNLKTSTEMASSALKCKDSLNSERVLRYLQNAKLNSDELKMTVLVQEFIVAEHSGVAFSVNPQTGDDQEIYTEFVEGCGDQLVSGLVTPSSCTLSWTESKLRKARSGELTLKADELSQLRDNTMRIHSQLQTPVDIEFAIKNGEVIFLQARPVTAIGFFDNKNEWTTADLRDGGVSSSCSTPFMLSLYGRRVSDAFSRYFKMMRVLPKNSTEKFCSVFYGRLYWKLSRVKELIQDLPGFN
ncbi:MAG: PEP/pyruvate-binding domain-containing protein, partial [Pseudomonadota bacterium]